MPPSPRRRRRRHRSSRSRSHERSAQAIARANDIANFWLVAAGLYWIMLLMAMHLPGDVVPREIRPEPGADGTMHTVAYAGFAFLLCRTFNALHRRRFPTVNPPLILYVFIFLGCITYGYVDEETQPWTGRTADAADWNADVLGAAIGCGIDLFLTIFLGRDPSNLATHRRRRHRHRHRHGHRSESGRRHRRRRSTPPSESPEQSVEQLPDVLPAKLPDEKSGGLDPGLA